jgi:hypothetical protein
MCESRWRSASHAPTASLTHIASVLDLSRWLELLGSELDYDYPTTEQPMGNSHIRHSRARVLGGW